MSCTFRFLRFICALCALFIANSGVAAIFVVDAAYDGINPLTACEQPAGATYYITPAAALAAAALTPAPPHLIRVCPAAYAVGTLLINNANHANLLIQGTTGNPATGANINGAAVDIFDVRQNGVTIQALTINNGRYAIETNAAGTNLNLQDLIINNTGNDSLRLVGATPTVSNVTINAAGAGVGTAADGIDARATTGIGTYSNITVNAAQNECVRIQGANSQLTNVNVNNCVDNGVQLTAANIQYDTGLIQNITDRGVLLTAAGIQLSNLTIQTVTVDGIQGNGNADNIVLSNIAITTATDDCIELQGDNVQLTTINASGCNDFGVRIVPQGGGTQLAMNGVTITSPTDDGVFLQNITAGTVTVSNVTVTNGADRGMTLNNINNATFTNLILTGNTTDGLVATNIDGNTLSGLTISGSGDDALQLSNRSDNNIFTNVSANANTDDGLTMNNSRSNNFSNSSFSNNDDGAVLTNRSNLNTYSNVLFNNNTDDGLSLNNSRNNVITTNEFDGNGDIGLNLTNNSRGNNVNNNLVIENTSYGARVFNANTSNNNTFTQNCFMNPGINLQNDETGGANSFDSGGQGNFYDDVPRGTGFSATCVDADDNGICDASYNIPGAAASVDNFPLEDCDLLTIAGLTFSKVRQTISDPVNVSNPKSIPGAAIRYTITADNSNATRTATADDATITDDLDNMITTQQLIAWVTDSMQVTAPKINAGATLSLTDVLDADAGEFDDTAGNRTITVRCDDVKAGQTCILTFEVTVQ